jgi:hypothetical protein
LETLISDRIEPRMVKIAPLLAGRAVARCQAR